MASVDPYSPCPCGSGQKFKWCCHKVESYADRAQRLTESGQNELAIQALDEGLKKEPGNAWLLTRKSLIQIRTEQPGEAVKTVRLVLEKNPKHAGALTLLTRLRLETESSAAGASQLQQALAAFEPARRSELAPLVRVVGAFLTETGDIPAALKHLTLAQALRPNDRDKMIASTIRSLETNSGITPWQRNPDTLLPPPDALTGEKRDRFQQAFDRGAEGLWGEAASLFATLSDDPVAGPRACRNLGFCRLWLAEGAAAVPLFRRYIATLGPTTEAVDLEVLAQEFDIPKGDDLIEKVQLSWPLRDRERLLSALRAEPTAFEEETGPLDPDDPDSPEVVYFAVLDRPRLDAAPPDLVFSQIPQVVARALVGAETVWLETFDDGRQDALADRFMVLSGTAIPPAHPKTKVLEKLPRLQNAMMWEWLLPEGIERDRAEALNAAYSAYLIREVWVKTPNRALRRRTPLQAAQAGDAEVALRAAVCQLEDSAYRLNSEEAAARFLALRQTLRIPPEPPIDPETVDVNAIHLSRLVHVPVAKLSDEKLAAYYRRARRYMNLPAVELAARAVIERPELTASPELGSLLVYSDLASISSSEARYDETAEWIRRGREADSPSTRALHAPAWDMLEIRMRAKTQAPEVWVPELAVVLERYQADQRSTQTVLFSLVDMGLIEMVPNPERNGEVMFDSRPLLALLSEYGPRVTTSSGKLGVSAARPDIWTPGAAGASGPSGGLWTPGSGAATSAPASAGSASGPSKLIIPGR